MSPSLLAALIRQESMCQPDAESWAGARGLTQVMPATGQEIAAALGKRDFVFDDLFEPRISVAFGAWYLQALLQMFGGDSSAALAAYNAGAGNARRWSALDSDAFVEKIDFGETSAYVRLVGGYHDVYRQLYERQ